MARMAKSLAKSLALVVPAVFVLSLASGPHVAVQVEDQSMAGTAIALPTPSATLPYDIMTNLGGMERFAPFSDPSYDFAHVNPEDSDYATAELRPWEFVTPITFTNRYWDNLTINGIYAYQTEDMGDANTTFSAEHNTSSPQLPPADFGLTQELIGGESALQVSTDTEGFVLERDKTVTVYATVSLPRSNMEYTYDDGTLGAYGYQFNFAVNMSGFSSDGREFVLEPKWGVNFNTGLFEDIRKGSEYDCSTVKPNGQVCSTAMIYSLDGRGLIYEFPPLETPPKPAKTYTYARPACEITSATTANGATTITARIDSVFEDTDAAAEYVFISGEYNGVKLEDATNGVSTPLNLGWDFIPKFDWAGSEGVSTVPADGEEPLITFAGPEVVYTFVDLFTTPRALTFTMDMVIAQVEGDMYPMACSIATGTEPAEVTPPVVEVVTTPVVEVVTTPVVTPTVVEVVTTPVVPTEVVVGVPVAAELAKTGVAGNIGLVIIVTLGILLGGVLLVLRSNRGGRD